MKDLPTSKKVLYGTLFGADIALTLFFLVVSIVMIVTMPKDEYEVIVNGYAPGFIGYFQQNPNVFLLVVVLPLLALFIVNIWVLITYAKKANEKKRVALNDLSEEEKAKLRAELMKDLQKGE